jgi:mannose-6-phosphate isomerase-like protein (cupin superfamily)
MKRINISNIPVQPSQDEKNSLQEVMGLKAIIHYENYSIANTTLKSCAQVPRHFHRVSDEVYIITAGSGEMQVDEDSFPLSAGDVILISPGEKHQVHTDKNEELEFLAITYPPYSPDDFITC